MRTTLLVVLAVVLSPDAWAQPVAPPRGAPTAVVPTRPLLTWFGIEIGDSHAIHFQLSTDLKISAAMEGSTAVFTFAGFDLDSRTAWAAVDLRPYNLPVDTIEATREATGAVVRVRYKPGLRPKAGLRTLPGTDGYFYATLDLKQTVDAPLVAPPTTPSAPVATTADGAPIGVTASVPGPRIREARRYTFDTAHALEQGEMLIGLGYLQAGLHDRLELGTVFLADLVGMLNVTAKLTLATSDNARLAVQAGFLYFNSDYSVFTFMLPEGTQVEYKAVPVTALLSLRLGRGQYLHASGTYAYQFARVDLGEPTSGEEMAEVTVAGINHTGGQLMYEHEVRRGDRVLVGAGVDYLDDVHPKGFASYVFGWTKFHLELGVAVGPTVDAEDPTKIATGFVPRGNLWWRF